MNTPAFEQSGKERKALNYWQRLVLPHKHRQIYRAVEGIRASHHELAVSLKDAEHSLEYSPILGGWVLEHVYPGKKPKEASIRFDMTMYTHTIGNIQYVVAGLAISHIWEEGSHETISTANFDSSNGNSGRLTYFEVMRELAKAEQAAYTLAPGVSR